MVMATQQNPVRHMGRSADSLSSSWNKLAGSITTMDREEIRKALEEDVFDAGLIHLGLADFLRDFQMYFYHSTYDANIIPHYVLKYRFVNCVVADSRTTLSPETWKGSLSDNLIGPLDDVVHPVDGWVWATRFGDMYPGARLLQSSEEAESWSASIGVTFYEALIEAPPIQVRLIFSDLVVERAVPGDSPFTVERPLGA